jgi:excisionase family DNA binding protein
MKNYTINEFCKEKKIGRTSVYKELNAGRLKAIKVFGKTLIPEDAVQEWQNNLPTYSTRNQKAI